MGIVEFAEENHRFLEPNCHSIEKHFPRPITRPRRIGVGVVLLEFQEIFSKEIYSTPIMKNMVLPSIGILTEVLGLVPMIPVRIVCQLDAVRFGLASNL